MLRIVGAVLLAALAVEDTATMDDRAEEVELLHEDLDFISIAGNDNLCLFNSFAHGTELRPAELRNLVCEFMRTNPTTVVADNGMTVRDFMAFERSSMNQLNARSMRYEGAGLAVAASLELEGEAATSRTSARPDVKAENRAGCRELLLRDDATAKTTMPPSLRQPISLGSAQSATASRRRTA